MNCSKSRLPCEANFGESSDFLWQALFAKIQKSGFLGKVLFFQNAKVRIFWKIAIFKKSAKARQNVESSGSKACGRLINWNLYRDCPYSTAEGRFMKENTKNVSPKCAFFLKITSVKSWKSGYFGQGLFGENKNVRIFWTRTFSQKCKSPDFLESGF